MKVAVLNFSGNVGKTTLAKHLLAPRIDGPLVSVESINDGDDKVADVRVRARHFRDLYEKIELADNIIVDVGASNIEEFVARMVQHEGSHEAIDLFVVPVTQETKQQKDTLATVERLHELGVPAGKILVVFNRVAPEDEVEKVFAAILNYVSTRKTCLASPRCVIYANEVFDLLRTDPELSSYSVTDLANESSDYWRDQAKAANKSGDEVAKRKALNFMVASRLSRAAKKNFDEVFSFMEKIFNR